jgi:hypothetical protein
MRGGGVVSAVGMRRATVAGKVRLSPLGKLRESTRSDIRPACLAVHSCTDGLTNADTKNDKKGKILV